MSVETLNAPMNDSAVIEHNNPINDPAASAQADADLGAVWDRLERDNGAARDEGGKFTSADAGEGTEPPADEGTQEPLEGGEGGEPEGAEISTPAPKVPLPATMTGLDEQWSKIPPEAQEAIAASQKKLHETVSNQGRALAAYKPVSDVFGEYQEYFNGQRGSYKPDEAVRFLFGLQRGMDDKPLETLLSIADTYELRPQLQQMFSAAAEGQGGASHDNTALLAEISELKSTIRQMADPSRIDERISTRLNEDRTMTAVNDVISRVATKEAMPLYAEVEAELPGYIQKAWAKLGETASQEAVLQRAYDMAVNADPDLRQKAAALTSAATPNPKLVADARKANSTNIRSTSTGKPRDATEDELLGNVWDKHKRD